jgi:2-methylcitrate dehydratase PrpD
MARPRRPGNCSACRRIRSSPLRRLRQPGRGSLQFLVNGAWNKRYQVGAAAMNGVIAATLARNDFVGSTESVEGKHGLSSATATTRIPTRRRRPRQDL